MDRQDSYAGLWWWVSGSPPIEPSTGPEGTGTTEKLCSQLSNLLLYLRLETVTS